MAFYPIQEVYFGRSYVQEAFEAFSKFRHKYISPNPIKLAPQIAKDPDLIAFNRAMEKTFGFESYCLYVQNTSSFEMGTMPVHFANPVKAAQLIKTKNFLVKTSNGFKYDKGLGVSVMTITSTGAIFKPDFTDEEIFAMLLHEVGHDFQEALSPTLLGIGFGTMISDLLIMIVNADFLNIPLYLLTSIGLAGSLNTINDWIQKTPVVSDVFNAIATVFTFSKGIFEDIMTFIKLVRPLPITLVFEQLPKIMIRQLSKINPFNIIDRVGGENIADSFAVMYGYGPELTSALYKFRQLKGIYGLPFQVIDRIPIVKDIIYINAFPNTLLTAIFDEHPNEYARANTAVKSLEADLKNVDPKFKNSIMKDIEKIQANTKEAERKVETFSPEQRDLCRNALDYVSHKIFAGGDHRDIVKLVHKHNKEMDRSINNAPYESDLPINKVKLK